jgi:plastocyanin
MSVSRLRHFLIAASLLALPAWSADHTVTLRRLQFEPEQLHIKVGDSVVFRNEDQLTHDLTAITPGSGFEDLSVEGSSTARVAFAKAGKLVLGCSLHDGMSLTVVVDP